MTVDNFFQGFEGARPLFDAAHKLITELGEVETRVTKSQIAFRHRVSFAWAWIPDRYLGGGHAPLVLSIALPRRDGSSRWKEIAEPTPGHFMHHLELYSASQLDTEVEEWLREAWFQAR